MKQLRIRAASYLGPDGHGNDRTKLRPWPAQHQAALESGGLGALHWTMLFGSDPARFERMDLMCRLGLMAAELLDAGLDSWPAERRDRVGVCVETSAGCLATDLRFLAAPRASLFAYTLPSTVIGEVCIRYRLRGPVLCLLGGGKSGSSALAEAAEWLAQGKAESCLCLVSEAIEPADAAIVPGAFSNTQWHAAALLLGGTEGALSISLPYSKWLADLCRELCDRSLD